MTVTAIQTVKDAYAGWYYTILGAGGDMREWAEGYQKMLAEQDIGTVSAWVSFKGADVNKAFKLTGNDRFQDDLTILAFPLDGLDIGKLAMFKLRMGDRWFTDVIDNSRSAVVPAYLKKKAHGGR